MELTIGSIWKNKKTNNKYILESYNSESKRVQIKMVGANNSATFMDVKSLKKNYAEITQVKTETPKAIEIVKPESVKPEPKLETVVTNKASRKFGKIELESGRVLLGINFLKEIVQDTESTAAAIRCGSVIYWLGNIEKGKAIMQKYNAKIVYDLPITK